MSTGPKRIKTRTNVHPRAGKQPEKRGGARAGAGRPNKVVRAKAADLRIEFIERLKAVNDDPTQLGKHWMDPWIEPLYNSQQKATNEGAKYLSKMFDYIFHETPASPRGWISPHSSLPSEA